MATSRRLFVLYCLLIALMIGTASQSGAFAAPRFQPLDEGGGDADSRQAEAEALAGLLGSPIQEDDSHFIADTGGDLDQYLFRTNLPDGRLKYTIPIKRYYFNAADANIRFDSNGFLTPSAASYAINKKILPATVQLRMRVFDVDEGAAWCPEVDLVFVNGNELLKGGQHVRLSGADDVWSVVSYDVPIRLLRFPQARGNYTRPTPAANEIAIRVDASNCTTSGGDPAWAVTVDYGILEIPSPVRPVVFAHGWTGTTESFKTIDDRLKEDGIPSGGPADLRLGLYPIPETASWLNSHIRQTALEFGVDKVNLFAHSKGGLVSRRSLYDDGVPDLIETLITFDTPHHGTEWADNQVLMEALCKYHKYPLDGEKAKLCWEATKEFSTVSVRKTFNYSGCTYNLFTGWHNCVPNYVQQPGVNYRTFAVIGEGIFNVVSPDQSTQYPWDDNQAPMPSWPDGKWRNVDGAWTADHSSILELPESYRCAVHLMDGSRYSCPTPPALASAVQAPSELGAAEMATQLIMTRFGSLPGSGVYSSSATVDSWSGQLLLEAYGSTSLDLTLVEPGGRLITPGLAASDPSIDYVVDRVFETYHYQYRIANPASGAWTARVQTGGEAAFAIVGAVASPVVLSVSVDAASYFPGDTITAQAGLIQSGTALQGGTMAGQLEQPSGSFSSVSFYDNGTNGDPLADDGVFTARMTAPGAQGQLSLRVAADRSMTHRETSILVPVSTQTGEIGSVTNEWTVDDDGDGLIDRVMIQLNLQVLQAGHFDLRGTLVDSHGDFVESAEFSTRSLSTDPLSQGTYGAVLAFDGQQIWQTGKDGRFTLTSLELSDSTRQVLRVDSVDLLYTTRTYARSQFERPVLGYETGFETAIDQNGNGRYDLLTFQLRFDVLPTGSYVVNGRLVDRNGDEIAWSSTTFSVPVSGVYPVSLSFDGAVIGEHGVDGPYTLKDVSVYDQAGAASAYFASLVTTRPYTHFQFENGEAGIYLPMVLVHALLWPPSTATPTPSPTPTVSPTPTTSPTPTPTPSPTPSGPEAQLWSAVNFGGAKVWGGAPGFSTAPAADSFSLKLPAGWSAKTWRGDGRTGEEHCWSTSVGNLQAFGWHQTIQSIEVFDFDACPSPASSLAPAVHLVGAPAIDGALTDWAGVPGVWLDAARAETHGGPQPLPAASDAAVKLFAGWTQSHLYLASYIVDDVVIGNESTRVWEDDDLEVGIQIGGHVRQFVFGFDRAPLELIDGGGLFTPAITVVTARVSGGWVVEAAIPVVELGVPSLASGETFPFTFGYWDDDDGGAGDSHLILWGESTNSGPTLWKTINLN